MLIIGAALIVVVGGGGFTIHTAIQNANEPPPADPLTLPELAKMFGGGDPFQPDPEADALKAKAAQALKERALTASRKKGREALNPIVIPTQAPGGSGFNPIPFPPGTTPDPGSNKALGRQMLAARGWTAEWGCLEKLWDKESNWNERAMNRYSGAYGIPQSLPGTKMASAGSDWQTNPATQIKWGLNYIAGRYKTPCAAWAHSQSVGWY
ncbi:hypothetical protein Misp01_24990 [Microtetraspora sp. NBRC 13810]|uniref:aggregation-promoting factor C-terminal-like domain-containing protein n=1 Tax=Microtetraspora sp. NBRC 13810 TaxID=3030990 RepID=UPI0024A3F60B|nr:transglycosylase SLT domain-containing protein [Microtetraspora sp. NBRC 13810]GLW07369.1 hypothetical protein Misp01_24990 [Microtetraspora sp. NBRC 13810]